MFDLLSEEVDRDDLDQNKEKNQDGDEDMVGVIWTEATAMTSTFCPIHQE